ncbi:very short patch repair endonuclease [Salinibacter ruber]|uniref:very short patch repair endonuclease n=1 Tax=Salinibacter ruber TaxID=146919 RepID=UPI0021670E12|nr:DNA mismatch endonuclease Vsr [Salinibacter ruber]MCS3782676.1 DNA mismatch endonuclease (patch repair protein) [Salinibacter ruber]
MSKETESQDHLSPEERSELMSRINSTETEPEQLTRSLLHREGYRFRKNVSDLPGTPDVVLPKYDTVIFVHGCYWHRHDCRKGQSVPTKNREFWLEKFERNVERDNENEKALRELGWQVLTVWECELNDDPVKALDRVMKKLDVQVNDT